MRLDDGFENRFSMFDIVAVTNTKCHIHSTLVLGRDVVNSVAPNLIVRNNKTLVIHGFNRSRDQTHVAYSTRDASGVD